MLKKKKEKNKPKTFETKDKILIHKMSACTLVYTYSIYICILLLLN